MIMMMIGAYISLANRHVGRILLTGDIHGSYLLYLHPEIFFHLLLKMSYGEFCWNQNQTRQVASTTAVRPYVLYYLILHDKIRIKITRVRKKWR